MRLIVSFSSTEDLVRLISESFDRIRHATSIDAIQPIVMSTVVFLKSRGREDLCTRFTNELHNVVLEWKTTKNTSSAPTITIGDNLNEENMEVDDEQDDKQKKQLSISEYNDVDYRFLDQDMDHRITTSIVPENNHHNERRRDATRKSRFSDVLLSHYDADDRTTESSFIEEGRENTVAVDYDSDLRTDGSKKVSSK